MRNIQYIILNIEYLTNNQYICLCNHMARPEIFLLLDIKPSGQLN